MSEAVKCDANLSAVVCQGRAASQTQECWEILAFVWGQAEECGLPVRDCVTSGLSRGPHHHTLASVCGITALFCGLRAAGALLTVALVCGFGLFLYNPPLPSLPRLSDLRHPPPIQPQPLSTAGLCCNSDEGHCSSRSAFVHVKPGGGDRGRRTGDRMDERLPLSLPL